MWLEDGLTPEMTGRAAASRGRGVTDPLLTSSLGVSDSGESSVDLPFSTYQPATVMAQQKGLTRALEEGSLPRSFLTRSDSRRHPADSQEVCVCRIK